MPRVRQKRNEYLAEDLRKAILKAGIDAGLKNPKEISLAVGIPYTTFLKRLQKPDTMSMSEVRAIACVLPIEKYMRPLLFGGGA